MIILQSENGITRVPEMEPGTRFKINDWFDENDFTDGNMPNIEFEVIEAFPDETGYVPCHCEVHQCAFDGLCSGSIDCCCGADERQDGKNVRYVEFINGQEYHF